MARFRESKVDITVLDTPASPEKGLPSMPSMGQTSGPVLDRSIGDIIAELRNLTAEQVEQVLARQREAGLRFGEAAVALGFASKADVLFALAQQFHYPYTPEEQRTRNPELVTLNEPFGTRAEYFRALRSQLMMRLFVEGQPRQALAVISSNTGDGKTYCASNLAVVLAQLGGRTLLVDADMRGPRVQEVFGLENRAGLSGILSGRADKGVIQQVAGVPSLFVLPVGITPPNPMELVERPAFGLLMRELASKFDHVVVDTPAAVLGADAAVIAARCGTALIVARKHVSKLAQMHQLLASFVGSPAKLAGVVMNEF
ncbi:MAG: polysaccharide biosynthesis tyrosine autokinase [Rubrivivax sp.]|nr:polysaccharide biosynthesis tyrosine autokinase [Rubrivivax sp.]